MKVLHVQFVRRTPGWVYLACALSLGLVVLAGARFRDALDMLQRAQDVQAEIASLQDRVVALKKKVSLAQRAPPYQAGAAQAAREAQFPLEAALGALEGVSVPGVKVMSVIVLPADASAQVELEYQSPDALATYMQQLAQLQTNHEWRLLKVQSENPPAGPPAQNSPSLPSVIGQAGLVTSTATLVWGDLAFRDPVTGK